MRHLLNTLCVTSEDAYLTLDGENIVVKREQTEVGRFPLHNLSGIVCFSYAGVSLALLAVSLVPLAVSPVPLATLLPL